MPDDDFISRRVPRHWRGAARLAMGNGTPQEMGPRLTAALAATLRDAGGVPGLNALGEALDRSRTDPERWAVESAEILRTCKFHRHTRMAVAAGDVLLEIASPKALINDDRTSQQRLAEVVLGDLVRRNLLGRIRPHLADQRFGGFGEARAFEGACLAETAIPKVATRLIQREDGVGLVAPAAPRREGTEALLHRSLAG